MTSVPSGSTAGNPQLESPVGTPPLLRVRELAVHFPVRSGVFQRAVGTVAAVDGVTFDIAVGETLGLVGESGCGKTTVGRAILRLVEKTSGSVIFDGRDVYAESRAGLRGLRQQMQIIFQDPAGSLNPRMSIGSILEEPLRVHGIVRGEAALRSRVSWLLDRCGMPASAMHKFPHEFSGGQRQRIGIARALALGPRFIVCDEPTSALDVSIQAQIINLLMDLQRDLGLSYLFISHDMNVVQHVCSRIAVMHRGKLVEMGTRDEILSNARQQYTRDLLAAVPVPDPEAKRGASLRPVKPLASS